MNLCQWKYTRSNGNEGGDLKIHLLWKSTMSSILLHSQIYFATFHMDYSVTELCAVLLPLALKIIVKRLLKTNLSDTFGSPFVLKLILQAKTRQGRHDRGVIFAAIMSPSRKFLFLHRFFFFFSPVGKRVITLGEKIAANSSSVRRSRVCRCLHKRENKKEARRRENWRHRWRTDRQHNGKRRRRRSRAAVSQVFLWFFCLAAKLWSQVIVRVVVAVEGFDFGT